MKWSRLFWVSLLAGAVLIGGAAWLSAQWSPPPGGRAANEGPAPAADLGSTRSRPGARQVAPEPARPSDTPAVAAGERAPAIPSPSSADVQPRNAPEAAGVPRKADAPALEADGVAAPRPGARPTHAARVNPVSGELMWSARDVIPDGGRPDEPLCGGKACRPGQFCCGPPECGRCAYPLAGPRCPSVCPGQTSN